MREFQETSYKATLNNMFIIHHGVHLWNDLEEHL